MSCFSLLFLLVSLFWGPMVALTLSGGSKASHAPAHLNAGIRHTPDFLCLGPAHSGLRTFLQVPDQYGLQHVARNPASPASGQSALIQFPNLKTKIDPQS